MSYNKETNEYEGYIYKITNNINGKIYIGQTITSISHRWGQHISTKPEISGQAITKAIDKYGSENFNIVEVEKICDKTREELIKKLNDREIFYIDFYNSYIKENGYNLTIGGNNRSIRFSKPVVAYNKRGELLFSSSSIAQMQEMSGCDFDTIKNCCEGVSVPRNVNYIFRYVDDSFDKYNIEYHNARWVKVYCYLEDGTFYKEFKSILSAAEELNLDYRLLIEDIRAHRIIQGYYFTKERKFDYIKPMGNKVPIDVYSINGELIGEYESISAAMTNVGLDVVINGQSNIKQCLNGKQKYALGYVWRYHGDSFDKYYVVPRLSYMKRINVYTIDDEFVSTFMSQSVAAKELGINSPPINSCLRGRSKTYRGYKFFYSNDENQPDKSKICDIKNTPEDLRALAS